MEKKTKSSQEKQVKSTDGSGDRENRFGRIVPAAHADNRARKRKPQGRGKPPLRPQAVDNKRNGHRAWPKMVVFFCFGVLLLYGAVMYLLVPSVVLGPLVREAGRILNCRLSIDTFSLSPFTFRFRAENILLKSPNVVGDAQKNPLLQIAVVSGRIQPLPLLQGLVGIEDLHIDQPQVFLTRAESGVFNLPPAPARIKNELQNSRLRLNPDIFSFQIVDGTFIFDDQLTGNRHRVEHLLYNPVAEDGVQLRAMVNGSPVTINRGAKDLLQLKLNNVELGRYLAYLSAGNELPVSISGRVDGTVEFSLPSATDDRRFTVQGTLALQNVYLADSKNTFQADVPAAGFSFQLTLPERRLRIRELVLRQPTFVLAAGSVLSFPRKPVPWLGKTVVQRLLIDRGNLTLQAGGRTFHFQDLQTSIRTTPGDGTGNDSSPATFQLSTRRAGDMGGELSVAGTIARGKLNGHLRVRGVDLANLPKRAGGEPAPAELKGAAELDAEILVQLAERTDTQQPYLRNSRLQLHDFQFLTRDGKELSGQRLLCQAAEFSFDMTPTRPLCDRLDLEQADIRFPMAGVVQQAREAVERGSSLFTDLELLDSTIHFIDDDKQDLVKLQRVLVRLHGLAGQVDNPGKVTLRATIGEKGVIRLSGNITPEKAQLEYAFKDVELTDLPIFCSWSPLEVKEGRIRARGRLILPEARATGKFVVDDFLAADPARGSLQWRKLSAQDVNLQLEPFQFLIDDVTLSNPVIRFQQGTDGFFPPFAADLSHDAWWRDTVVLKKIVLTGGEFQSGREAVLSDLYPRVTKLAGTIEGWPADPFSFTVHGNLEEGMLQIRGEDEGTSPASSDYVLQVNDFPLSPLADDFLQAYGLVADDAAMSWQSVDSTGMDERRVMRCRLKNLQPAPGSPLEYTLALLTDSNEEIALNVEPVEDNGHPLLLVPRVVDRLQAIRLRELDQPGATLRERLPFLELPDTVEFQIGLDGSEQLFFLDDYAELLQSRPHLRLVVVGSVDPAGDEIMIREVLQEEADARLEVENLRRQQKRDQWIYRQELAAATGSTRDSSDESTRREQLPVELRPLPRQLVEVPVEMLKNLAGKRAEQVRQYLISRQGIDPERITVQKSTQVGSAAVYLSLEPFYPTAREAVSDDIKKDRK